MMLLTATEMRLRFPLMDEAQRLAYWLQAARERQGLTRHELADRLRVAYTTVYNWERGNKVPNILMLGPLCDALGVSADLFRRLPSEPRSPVEDYLEEAEEAQSRARQRVRGRRPPTP